MTTPCPSAERIAAAASGEDDDAATHAETCAVCGPLVVEQRDIGALLRQLPAPPLVGEQRRTLEALMQARLDQPMSARRRFPVTVGIVAVAAAATVAFVMALPGRDADDEVTPPTTPGVVAVAPAASGSPVVAASSPVAAARSPSPAIASPARPAVIDMSRADADHEPRIVESAPTTHKRDVVTLRAGTLTIDTRDHRDAVDVVAGSTRLHVADAKVRITARASVVESVQVFAGSVEMTVGTQRTVIEDIWEAPVATPSASVESTPTAAVAQAKPKADPKLVKPKSPAEQAMADFREGWTSFHDGEYDEAIALFDRATDPVVLEDAAYWAAVATDRLGHRDDAVVRFRAFMIAFPSSPRGDDARHAIELLTH